MVRMKFSQALFISSLVAASSLAFAQGAMPPSSPNSSNLATKPQQSPAQTPTQSLDDAQITTVIMTANTAEVNAGKHAEKAAKSKEVKEFAKQMVTDHSQSNKEVKELNQKLGVKEQGSAIRDQLQTAAKTSDSKLKSKKGKDFDKTYIEEQVTMHQTVLDTIDTQLVPNAKSEDLKTLLTKVRSTVATHLEHAKQLQSSSATM